MKLQTTGKTGIIDDYWNTYCGKIMIYNVRGKKGVVETLRENPIKKYTSYLKAMGFNLKDYVNDSNKETIERLDNLAEIANQEWIDGRFSEVKFINHMIEAHELIYGEHRSFYEFRKENILG